MEISFDHVSYKESETTIFLQDFHYTFASNQIHAILTEDVTKIPELMTINARPTSGSISIDGILIKKTNRIQDIAPVRKRIGIVSCLRKQKFLTKTVYDQMAICLNNYDTSYKNVEKRIKDSLKMVGLDETYLMRNPNELSSTEQKKVLFATALSYNPDVLVFEYYEKGLSFKEKQQFKQLLCVFKSRYHKTIIIVTDDVEFLFELVDNMIVINNGSIVFEGTNKSFYDVDLYKYVDMPEIVEFIMYVNQNGHKIENYTDLKELIKGIYRDVS